MPLPSLPVLAEAIGSGIDTCKEVLKLHGREVPPLSITNISQDGQMFFVAARVDGMLRDGWVRASTVRLLSTQEAAALPADRHLSIQEMLVFTQIVRVTQDWPSEAEAPAYSLRLIPGELVQVKSVSGNVAFGWPIASPGRRGFFPMAYVEPVERGRVSALARLVPEEPLVSWRPEKKAPPASFWRPPSDMPQIVVESDRLLQRDLMTGFDKLKQERAAGMHGSGEQEDGDDIHKYVQLDPEFLPLFVCRERFRPPECAKVAMLELQVGDLVRVSSPLEQNQLYFGMIDHRLEHRRGWFPARNVKLVDHPLHPELVPAPVTPWQIPDELRRLLRS